MKRYYVPVEIMLYADSPEMAREEIRRCLTTGRGHVEGWSIGTPNIRSGPIQFLYPDTQQDP